jgi:hypothetical protein
MWILRGMRPFCSGEIRFQRVKLDPRAERVNGSITLGILLVQRIDQRLGELNGLDLHAAV